MKKIKNIVLTLILMLVGLNSVNAEDYKIIVEAVTGNAGSGLTMKLEGIDVKEAVENNYSYYIKFQDEKPSLTGNPYDSQDGVNEGIDSYFSIYINENYDYQNISIDDDWYLIKGYTNAYLIKCVNYNNCEVIDNKIVVERPELPALGQRYQNYLFGESEDDSEEYENTLSVFPYFPFMGEIGSHELNVKIGLIKDNNLLKSLSKNEAGSLDKLLEYAKTNDGKIIKNKDTEFNNINIGNFEVTNGAYYYMYTYYTNEDGLYRNLDDITVVMGEADTLVNDVEWNLEDSEWDKFVESFKTTELFEILETEEGNSVDVTYTSNSLRINLNSDDTEIITNFNYKDGILEYVPSDNEENIFIDSYWVSNAIYALANLKGYELEKLKKWEVKPENLTIKKDGIQIKTEEYKETTESDIVNGSISVDKVVEFKLDIINGLKTYDPNFVTKEDTDNEKEETTKPSDDKTEETTKPSDDKTEEIKNPDTGLRIGFGIVLLTMMCLIGYMFMKKNSKFPKHN